MPVSVNKVGDVVFDLDAAYVGFPITWNVTRIQRDALTRAFGELVSVPMANLPPLGPEERARIDWHKVEAMLGAHLHKPDESPLEIPVLQVALRRPDGVTMRIPVDGNHRICARKIAGEADFKCYVVPPELEPLYRVIPGTSP